MIGLYISKKWHPSYTRMKVSSAGCLGGTKEAYYCPNYAYLTIIKINNTAHMTGGSSEFHDKQSITKADYGTVVVCFAKKSIGEHVLNVIFSTSIL